MKVKSDIPVFNLGNEAIGGIHIAKLSTKDTAYLIEKMGIHRDEYYIFFVLTEGNVVMLCDGEEFVLESIGVGFIRPFQVHSVEQITENMVGYFISIAPFLVPDSCLEIFQNIEIVKQGKKIHRVFQEDLISHISLLHNSFHTQKLNKPQIISGLFNALIYEFANLFQSSEKTITIAKNQSVLISTNFKKLINRNNFLQSPSFFAKKLNISPSHLTDCVSENTGKSPTYWLQNAMIIEAQRFLYYTENDVKQIAYTLGFEDHSYFSRIFKKVTNETPINFRKKFRK